MPTLAHTILQARGNAAKRLWLLHGVLGSGRNWRSFGRRLQGERDDLEVVLVDLRAHGESKGFTPPHTLSACVDDLQQLTTEIGMPTVVCGHSFGGKVALMFAGRQPSELQQVWTLDSPPGLGPTVPGEIDQVISSLRKIPMPVVERYVVKRALLEWGFSEMLAGWMTTNLERTEADELTWRFDLDAIEALLADYFNVDAWPILENRELAIQRHVVHAARSQRFSPQDLSRLAAATVHGGTVAFELPDAGHWVHVDNPAALHQWAIARLAEVTPR